MTDRGLKSLRDWIAVLVSVAGLLAVLGSAYVVTQAKAVTDEANRPQDEKIHALGERVVRVETQMDRLSRMEADIRDIRVYLMGERTRPVVEPGWQDGGGGR